jgi:signal transduction histidine kinase
VFARRGADELVVAIVVDLRPLLARLRLLAASDAALLVLGAHGLPSPSSDERIAEAVRALPGDAAATPGLARLVDDVRARRSATVTMSEAEAARLGLPRAAAVGVAVPVVIEDGEPWGLVLASSTLALRTQERTLVRRLIVGGALAAGVLVLLSASFVWNARRTAVLRERLRQADQVAHAEKLATAGQLAAGIAHEIGTPLNVVRGRAELALARLGAGHPQAAGLQIIVEQIDHVSGLIRQLLDYVRPVPPVVTAVPGTAALRSAAQLLAPEATKRGIALEVDAPEELPSLRADAGQLQQVLVNLAMNALDACARGGRVTLRARRAGASVELEVEDDGVGIPAASRAQVFDPFFTTKKRGQGTGLGLWIVAQLVRAHDAAIELTSASGSGTKFRITWPVHPS